jgi:hypothetical protein
VSYSERFPKQIRCHKHKTRTSDKRKRVILSDESSFRLFPTSGRVCVWRTPKEVHNPECLAPTVKQGEDSVMVWAAISWYSILLVPLLLYNIWPLLDAKCNLLAYRRHHSICYTRLFTTPLVVVTISPLQFVLTLWCRDSERSFVLFSVLSSMSVCPECWQLTIHWFFSSLCLLSASVAP